MIHSGDYPHLSLLPTKSTAAQIGESAINRWTLSLNSSAKRLFVHRNSVD